MTSSPHQIRAATGDDVPAIRDLYARSWRASYEDELDPDALNEKSQQRGRDFDWHREIDDPGTVVLVGVAQDGSINGVVQATDPPGPPRDLPELAMLYLDPAVFGTGLAGRLLEGALRWVAGRGYSGIRLRVVESHDRARAFYEREGWSIDPALASEPTDIARVVYYQRALDPPP